MRTLFLRVALLVFCLASFRFLIAQAAGQSAASASTPAASYAPDPDSGMTGHVEGLFIPLVTGQPFHTKIAVTIHHVLPDGTVVDQKYYTLAARDADGREYREARDVIPADSDRDPPIVSTRVYNPKTSLITTCTPDQRICRRMTFDPTQHPVDEPVGPSSDGKSVLTRENLGTKMMDGVQVVGTRETRTFNPGAFGNDKPVVVTKEIWYSPQLQFNLSVTRLDPRNGTQKLDVTELKLGDPGAEWFTTPDGYRFVMGRGIQSRPMWPAELQPLIEKNVSGMSSDQLATALQPVEAAIGAYAKAHAADSPNDNSEAFAGQLRMRLSGDLRMTQQMRFPPKAQLEDAGARLNETFREVATSPCINKPQPGDPPSMPSSAEGLRAEEAAWVSLRDAWTAFLAKLFPESDPAGFGWMLTNERDSELRRLQNVERNRGCVPEESIEPLIARFVTGLTSDQLDASLKPVDAAIRAYAKAHAESEPNQQNENFNQQIEQQLAAQLRMQERDRVPTQDQFEEADLHLNQAFRAVIASPCLAKTIPGDPPNAPVSEEKLRAEERSWIALRDAWTAFMTAVFPNEHQSGFGTMLTEMRTGELMQIQNIERNRGCTFADQ
ncbi:MAG: lysozyme inhibitor LprI family protein [Terracidiphilus sp.]